MAVLISTFTGWTKINKQQALVQLQINNVLLDQIILISPQSVTPFLLGIDFCIGNHVVIDILMKTLVINAGDEESATEVSLVNKRQNSDISIDSPVSRTINLGTANLPPTPERDRMENPSISDHPALLYKGRLPDRNLCSNQMTIEEMTWSKGLWSVQREC
jgi:hypothetical protein